MIIHITSNKELIQVNCLPLAERQTKPKRALDALAFLFSSFGPQAKISGETELDSLDH